MGYEQVADVYFQDECEGADVPSFGASAYEL